MRFLLPFAILLLVAGAAIADNCTDVLNELREMQRAQGIAFERITQAFDQVAKTLVDMMEVNRQEFSWTNSDQLDTYLLVEEMAENVAALKEKVETAERKLLFAEGFMHSAILPLFSGSTALASFMEAAEERYRAYMAERIQTSTAGSEWLRDRTQAERRRYVKCSEPNGIARICTTQRCEPDDGAEHPECNDAYRRCKNGVQTPHGCKGTKGTDTTEYVPCEEPCVTIINKRS